MARPSKFGMRPEEREDLPSVLPSRVASASYPFGLRVHRDRWSYAGGRWELDIERVGLRPGVGGVGGRPGDLYNVTTTALRSNWESVDDGRWIVMLNGDQRLRQVFPDGNFLLEEEVRAGREVGTIFVAPWEYIDDVGKIRPDLAKMKAAGDLIAKHVLGLDGPTPRAIANSISGYKALLRVLESSATSSRSGPSRHLRERMQAVRKALHDLTGDDSYLDEAAPKAAPKKRQPKKQEVQDAA